MRPNKDQEALIIEAGLLIKKAFPNQGMLFNFNLSKDHDNINYNLEGKWKISGILNPKKNKMSYNIKASGVD